MWSSASCSVARTSFELTAKLPPVNHLSLVSELPRSLAARQLSVENAARDRDDRPGTNADDRDRGCVWHENRERIAVTGSKLSAATRVATPRSHASPNECHALAVELARSDRRSRSIRVIRDFEPASVPAVRFGHAIAKARDSLAPRLRR
jgi:hypothetical protein